MSDKLWYHSP